MFDIFEYFGNFDGDCNNDYHNDGEYFGNFDGDCNNDYHNDGDDHDDDNNMQLLQ